jgi:DNA repair protein RadD
VLGDRRWLVVVLKLRDYQADMVASAGQALRSGSRRVLLQLPTGGGKTVVLSDIADRATRAGKTVMVIAHRKEIVRQIAQKLQAFGMQPALMVSGEKCVRWQTSPLVAAMQQTLVRRLSKVTPPDYLIVDEAHHQAAAGYQAIASAWPDTMIVGLTATPARLDGKPLSESFDELICGPTVRDLIERGALSGFRYFAPPLPDGALQGVRKVAGDYVRGELEAAVSRREIVGSAVEHYKQHLQGAPAIAFCVSVAHAELVRDEFKAAGFSSESIDGGMQNDRRDDIIERFRQGRISVLTSCDLIGEGFDVPECAGVLLMRPTASLTIYLQQVGRALRPKSDGGHAIILDHANNILRHGAPDAPRQWSLEGRVKDDVGVRQCKTCHMVFKRKTVANVSEGAIVEPDGATHQHDSKPHERCVGDTLWRECGMVSSEGGGGDRNSVEYVDGQLIEVRPSEYVEWCDVDVRNADGKDYARLLRAAGEDEEKLRHIAKVRGYKPAWVHVRLEQVRRKRARS